MNQARLLALWWADAWRCLVYERSRAASPAQALRTWVAAQGRRWQRWQRMGGAGFHELLRAEAAGAKVGLNYPAEDTGQVAPWHLPERFRTLSAAELPAHPVIDPAVLAAAATTAGPPSAAMALLELAEAGAGSTHWRALPTLASAGLPAPPTRTAVCLHLFYPDLWPVLFAQLQHIPERWDLFVTVPSFAATGAWQSLVDDCPRVRLVPLPNRGRDVAPWLHLLGTGALDPYDAVCKIHGKRSPHMRGGGDAWRDALLQTLLGNGANIAAILARFRACPELAVLGPAASRRRLDEAPGWAKNVRNVDLLAKRQGLGRVAPSHSFFAGTMFWFRPAAHAGWRGRPRVDDFPIEMGQTEGTLAHALERVVTLGLGDTNGRVVAWPTTAADSRPSGGAAPLCVPAARH